MSPSKELRIGFVGAGVVGSALAVGFRARGYRVVAVASRRAESAVRLAERIAGCDAVDSAQTVIDACDLVFLTVPDDAIGTVAQGLSGRSGQAVVHCSGGLSLEPLASLAATGAQVGSFHPLQAFAGGGIEQLAGITYGLEGEEPLISTLEEMACDLGGRPLRLPPGSKMLYHASAVMASNYLVTLAQLSSDLWAHFGVPRDHALAALLPLIDGTVANLKGVGLPTALTGPIARGDVGTVRQHLETLERSAPEAAPLYRQLGLRTVPIGRARGTVSAEEARQLKALLTTSDTVKGETTCV